LRYSQVLQLLLLSTGRTEEEVEELVNNAMGLDD
jgi:hypothetical protein